MSVSKHGVMVMAGTGDYSPAHEDIMGFLLDELEEVSAGSKLPTPNLGMRIGRWITSSRSTTRASPRSLASARTCQDRNCFNMSMRAARCATSARPT